jgi:hypothetical protein
MDKPRIVDDGEIQMLPPEVAKWAANPPPPTGDITKAIAASKVAVARRVHREND